MTNGEATASLKPLWRTIWPGRHGHTCSRRHSTERLGVKTMANYNLRGPGLHFCFLSLSSSPRLNRRRNLFRVATRKAIHCLHTSAKSRSPGTFQLSDHGTHVLIGLRSKVVLLSEVPKPQKRHTRTNTHKHITSIFNTLCRS